MPPTSSSTALGAGIEPTYRDPRRLLGGEMRRDPAERRGYLGADGVPPHQRVAAVRVRADRRAEDAAAASRRGRHRPRVRQPRHPVARRRGREARRGRAQSAQPPLLDEQGHPEAARWPSPTSTERKFGVDARLRDRGLLDDRREGGLLAPDAHARRAGRHRARCRARRTRSTSGDRSSRARACTTCAWDPSQDFFENLHARVRTGVAAAARDRHVVPAQPDDRVRRPRVHGRSSSSSRASATSSSSTTSRTPTSASTAIEPPSILQVPGAKDVAVELYTLTKSFSMAGWRMGFLVGNAEIVAALAKLEVVPRLRHVPADPDRGHRRDERGARLPEGESTRSTAAAATR